MDRRKGVRHRISFEVLVSIHNTDSLVLQAVDISEVGIYLLSEGEPPPPLGSVIQLKLNGNIGTEQEDFPLVDMIIKRVDSTGIGLQYLQPGTMK